jgi:general secretion pathway protein L
MVGLINDLTTRIPLDTYLERLQIESEQVQLQGQAEEASKLIALLGASPCLGNPGFQGQVQPDARTGKDRFQINAVLKDCGLSAGTGAPAPPPTAADPDKAVEGKPVGGGAADGKLVRDTSETGKPEDGNGKPGPGKGVDAKHADPAKAQAKSAEHAAPAKPAKSNSAGPRESAMPARSKPEPRKTTPVDRPAKAPPPESADIRATEDADTKPVEESRGS